VSGSRLTLILTEKSWRENLGGRGLTAEFLSATQEVWVRLPPSAPNSRLIAHM
jgi:hypothetical protein